MAKKSPAGELKGWKDIAEFLGQPVATAQRWAKSGMPVRRSGRYVVSSPEELSRWLGAESGSDEPVQIARTGTDDLLTALKRGLTNARKRRSLHRAK
jgi:phage terminase Nu1 subunit (DNA packaging protein)